MVPALTILLGALGPAKADPRIDRDTAAQPVGAATDAAAAVPTPIETAVAQQGVASWYGRHWRGRRTASGVRYDERLLTAASLTLPLATRAHVVNLQNGRSIDVLVNDRGPYVGGRIIDLSTHAASLLGMLHSGVAVVAVTALIAPSASGG